MSRIRFFEENYLCLRLNGQLCSFNWMVEALIEKVLLELSSWYQLSDVGFNTLVKLELLIFHDLRLYQQLLTMRSIWNLFKSKVCKILHYFRGIMFLYQACNFLALVTITNFRGVLRIMVVDEKNVCFHRKMNKSFISKSEFL